MDEADRLGHDEEQPVWREEGWVLLRVFWAFLKKYEMKVSFLEKRSPENPLYHRMSSFEMNRENLSRVLKFKFLVFI